MTFIAACPFLCVNSKVKTKKSKPQLKIQNFDIFVFSFNFWALVLPFYF